MRCLIFTFLAIAEAAAIAQAEPRLQTDTTANGVRFAWLGEKPAQPAPTVFFAGGSIEDSLNKPEQRVGMGSGILFVSIDLPSHGQDLLPGEPGSLRGWQFRLEQGNDFVKHFVQRASAVLDHVIARKYTDPARWDPLESTCRHASLSIL